MASNSKTFEVKFIGDTKGLKGSINDLQNQGKSLGRSFTGLGGIMKGALGALSFVGIASGFKNLIADSKTAASDINRLRHILINASGATNAQVDALIQHAGALEKVGVVSKANIIATQSQLATFNLQASTIKTLTPAILNYVVAERGASATTEDFKSMTNGLALALDGQFASLTRVGFVMDKETKKQIQFGSEMERATAIVDVLNSTYKGFNESLAKTPEGRVILLNRAMSELKGTIGQALLPVFLDLVDVFNYQIMPLLKAFIDGLVGKTSLDTALTESGKKAFAWGTVVRSVLNTIISFKKPLLVLAAVMAAMWAVSGIGTLIAAIGNVINILSKLRAAAVVAGTALIFGTGGTSVVPSLAGVAAMIASIGGTMVAVNAMANKFSDSIENIPPIKGLEDSSDLLNDLGGGFERVSDAGKKAAAAQKAVNDQIAKFKELLGNANKVLDDAKGKYNEYAKSVSDTFKAVINFGGAFSKSQDSIQNAEESLQKLFEAQIDYENALSTGSIEEQNDALINLMKAQQEATKSVTNKKTFLQTLVDQASKAQEFAVKVQELIRMGLSETAIQQVLSAGADAGTAIADEIIAGGSTVVDQVNTLITATASVAEQVGKYGAEEFYRAGITQGEALVRGILDAIKAAGLIVDVSGNITSPAPQVAPPPPKTNTGGGGSKPSKKKTPDVLKKLAKIPALAAGGIVQAPTIALVGEAGPEAVVPLDKMPMGGNTYNLTINAGMGADGAAIGREIVDAIKRYERTSGPVFASA